MYGARPRTRTSTADSLLSSAPSTSSTSAAPPRPTGPILSRREINEVFSNFADVLNLAHVMLLALEEAVPPRPSQPVAIASTPDPAAGSASRQPAVRSAPTLVEGGQGSSVEENALSCSGGTVDSEGPTTPGEDGSQPLRPGRKVVPSQRTLSTRSARGGGRSKAVAPAPPLRLGAALLPILPFFKQYSLFVANFSASLSLLSRLDGSSSSTRSSSAAQWQAFVATQQQRGEGSAQAGKIGLAGLLLNIVQRVPRYRLLLQDLLRFTDEDHPDARDLQAAFDLVDGGALALDRSCAQTRVADSIAVLSRLAPRLADLGAHQRPCHPRPAAVLPPRLVPLLAACRARPRPPQVWCLITGLARRRATSEDVLPLLGPAARRRSRGGVARGR